MKSPICKSSVLILALFLCSVIFPHYLIFPQDEPQEKIIYGISPFGTSEYSDFGLVELEGVKANLAIFKTQVGTFRDTEKIFSEPKTLLPLRVERGISFALHKENLIEKYNPAENKLGITKFKNGKQVREYNFQAKGPISNAIMVPFSLRKLPDLRIGWSTDIRLPQEFKVTLVSIEEVTVPAGKFKAFHFTSEPNKFEIWISADSLRIPVKIKGVGFPYTLAMKKHVLSQPAGQISE